MKINKYILSNIIRNISKNMKFKFELYHLLIIIVLLCIFYFIYRQYEERKTQEKFENQDYQALSAYYKNSTDSNDIQKYLLPLNNPWSVRKVNEPETPSSTILSQIVDPWTGTYRNYDYTNTNNLSADDAILVLRKLGDQVSFTVGKRSMLNYGTPTDDNDITNNKNPYYTTIGKAKISPVTYMFFNNKIDFVPKTGSTRVFSATITHIGQDHSGFNNLFTVNTSIISITLTYDNNNTWNFTKAEIIDGLNKKAFNYKQSATINMGNISSNINQSSKIFNYNNDIIQPFYIMEETDENTGTLFKDLNCGFGKQLCTFVNSTNDGNTYYGCASTENISDGNCNFTSSIVSNESVDINKVCALGMQNSGNTQGSNLEIGSTYSIKYTGTDGTPFTANVQRCDPNYDVNIGGYDLMLNKIQDDEASGKLKSCTFLSDMTDSYNYYIMYFHDKNNFMNLSFQYWGESNNESRLLMVKNILNTQYASKDNSFKSFINTLQSLNTGLDDKNDYTLPPVNYDIKPDLGNLSCYFSINSQQTKTKPKYYVQAQTNGNVNMTLLEGGFDKYFTLVDVIHDSTNYPTYFAGHLRSSNGLYLNPGNSSIHELSPVTGTNERVCTLTSQPPSGYWVILGYNKSSTDPLA